MVIGQMISLFGNAILRFALPLYLLRETGSALLYGMCGACAFIPTIVCSLAGGVVADRLSKRNIMAGLDFGTALLIFLSMVLSTMFTIQICTIVQQQTPSRLLGKTMAIILAIVQCAMPMGQLMYGYFFEKMEAHSWLILMSAASIAFIVSLYSKKVFRQLAILGNSC